MSKKDRIGEESINNFGSKMIIKEYRNATDIDVYFPEYNWIAKNKQYNNFKNGCVKCPYERRSYGIGYLGEGKYKVRENGKKTKCYKEWIQMLQRCYDPKTQERQPTYKGCLVCEEWHNYQNFASWHKEHRYKINERLHLDKDILFAGNKEYSSSKCLLVPQRLNMMFMNKSNNRGLPNGIAKYKSGYLAKYGGKELGIFLTVEEAYIEQTKKKKEAIEELANEYKNIIPKEVYDAVMAYEFRIENDKNYRKCF